MRVNNEVARGMRCLERSRIGNLTGAVDPEGFTDDKGGLDKEPGSW